MFPAPAAAAIPTPPKSVTAAIYRTDVLPPLLNWAQNTFQSHGVSQWRWQQDNARAHTVGDTPAGRATRAVITPFTPNIVSWPAQSPDLSPIEKAWATAEAELWANHTWSNQREFEAALRQAWAAAITPAYCRKLFGGVRATYDFVAANGGARIAGWGRSVKLV